VADLSFALPIERARPPGDRVNPSAPLVVHQPIVTRGDHRNGR
jgi:hypothetical protein